MTDMDTDIASRMNQLCHHEQRLQSQKLHLRCSCRFYLLQSTFSHGKRWSVWLARLNSIHQDFLFWLNHLCCHQMSSYFITNHPGLERKEKRWIDFRIWVLEMDSAAAKIAPRQAPAMQPRARTSQVQTRWASKHKDCIGSTMLLYKVRKSLHQMKG